MIIPLYIFDLDGTLANNKHRQAILETDDPDKWDKFNLACDKDSPNYPVIYTYHSLINSGAEIWIFSGRSDIAKSLTVDWLKKYANIHITENDPKLVMRPQADNSPDEVLKKSWYDNMMHEDKERLVAVFDDRNKVVQMWRDSGVACFQVAPGDF